MQFYTTNAKLQHSIITYSIEVFLFIKIYLYTCDLYYKEYITITLA